MLRENFSRVFKNGYTPSSVEVAQALSFLTSIDYGPQVNREAIDLLRRNGYRSAASVDPDGFIPGRTSEEKDAYLRISQMMEHLINATPLAPVPERLNFG